MSIDLLNGAFTATLVKAQKGPARWQYAPVLHKIAQKSHSEKEKPQYPVIEQFEATSKTNFSKTLSAMTMDIARYLKTLI